MHIPQVSPLKSLLREDLKRRITARANSRPNRNSSHHHSNSNNNNAITVTTDGGNSATNVGAHSNVPSIMAAAVAAAAATSNTQTTNHGAITSTGNEIDLMTSGATSSSRKQRMLQCLFCGIEFPDQTLYFLHKGCHSESNHWKCNICGEQLGNVYEFNSHLLSKSHQ